ncbi:hypothetical protein D3Z48_09220 [Clostridiaceae bacterium]|nr:hypothetical protein [Clostridiaceae bacterium]
MSEKMYAEEELVREVRAANIVRGKWFALLAKHIPAEIFDEAAKKACWEFGLSRKEAAGGECGSSIPMAEYFASGASAKVFQCEILEKSPEKTRLHIGSCPLVEGFRQVGCTPEQIAHYCDLICNGDYGTADSVGLTCTFGELIAHGGKVCDMTLALKK